MATYTTTPSNKSTNVRGKVQLDRFATVVQEAFVEHILAPLFTTQHTSFASETTDVHLTREDLLHDLHYGRV